MIRNILQTSFKE
ncbi:hypothetical protein AS859_02830 [Aliarcobacter cryaerophilus]|uniref:Uncharacterized protein n=1 Tax=Aliarcobacter cryaerophilus TaxID=28198 RepID=A0A1V9VDF2_9BACT|nr:hypothetical protein AS859_02830 [Aliarcobacter cryaerophilus]